MTDPWATTIPTWLSAIGSISASVIALLAFIGTIRNRGGLNTVVAGLNLAQSSAAWSIEPDRKNRYRLVNRGGGPMRLLEFEDVTPDGNGRASLLTPLPLDVDGGVGVPFKVDKALAGPAVTAIRVRWDNKAGAVAELTFYV